MKIFATVFITLVSILTYLLGINLIPNLTEQRSLQNLYWIIHIIGILTIVSMPFVNRSETIRKKNWFFDLLQWLSYYLMGFYFLLLFMVILKWPLHLIFNQQNFNLYFSVISIFSAFVLTLLGYWTASLEPQIKKVKIKVDNEDLKNFKIVQLSDVHVSHTIKKSYVEKIVNITNSLSPDLIALTGDLVDGLVAHLKDDIEPMRNLKAKFGVYFAPGNHEYYWNVEEWLEKYRNLNFKVLLNQSEEIKIKNASLLIGGVHDLASQRINKSYKCDPDLAFSNKHANYKILLAHQPKTINLIKDVHVDLVLSGHTHAGQFFPANILIFLFQPYVKGLHKIKSTWLYINQGTGYWGPPNRLGTRSEITLIEFF